MYVKCKDKHMKHNIKHTKPIEQKDGKFRLLPTSLMRI